MNYVSYYERQDMSYDHCQRRLRETAVVGGRQRWQNMQTLLQKVGAACAPGKQATYSMQKSAEDIPIMGVCASWISVSGSFSFF